MLYHTPWGRPQDQQPVAPGITRVSTASHGGYHVDTDAMTRMPPGLATFSTFAGGDGCGGQWFEEDQDWCVVALAFPAVFQPYDVWCALQTFLGSEATLPRYSAASQAFIGPAREEVERVAGGWYESHREHWRQAGYSCGNDGGWRVTYVHLSSGEVARREVSGPEFRALGPVVAQLPGVPFEPTPRLQREAAPRLEREAAGESVHPRSGDG